MGSEKYATVVRKQAGMITGTVVSTAPLHAPTLSSSPCMHESYLTHHLCQPALATGDLRRCCPSHQRTVLQLQKSHTPEKERGAFSKTPGKYVDNGRKKNHVN